MAAPKFLDFLAALRDDSRSTPEKSELGYAGPGRGRRARPEAAAEDVGGVPGAAVAARCRDRRLAVDRRRAAHPRADLGARR